MLPVNAPFKSNAKAGRVLTFYTTIESEESKISQVQSVNLC